MAVIGALQGSIVICGALLRPIIIRPNVTQETDTTGSSPKELEALATQAHTNPDDSMTNTGSYAHNTSHSGENEFTISSVSTRDSGVLSQDSNSTSPEELILLGKEAKTEMKHPRVETEIKESEDQKKDVAEIQLMKNKLQAKKPKLLDFTILQERSFIFYSLFGLFATLGFFAPQLYIVEMSVTRGVEREHAAYMLSIMAVAEIVGRFSIGWIMTQNCLMKKKVLVLLASTITMTVDLFGFTLVTEFYGLAVCCALYGFLMGTISCTHIPILAEDDVVGLERMSSAAGVYVFIHSFAGLAGPPLGGTS